MALLSLIITLLRWLHQNWRAKQLVKSTKILHSTFLIGLTMKTMNILHLKNKCLKVRK